MAVCCAMCKKMRRVCSPEQCRVQKVIASGAANNVEIEFLIDEVNADFIEKGLYGLPRPHAHGDGDALYLMSFLYEQDIRKKFMKMGSQGVNISLKAEIEQVKAKRREVETQINLAKVQLAQAKLLEDQAYKQVHQALALYHKRLAEVPNENPTAQSLQS